MLTPHLLATLFDRCIAAQLHRNLDEKAAVRAHCFSVDSGLFTDWLARHWQHDGPPEPAAYPDAVSFFGAQSMARGPRWYAVDDVILGFLPDSQRGCYRVPMHELLPGVMQTSRTSLDGDQETWA